MNMNPFYLSHFYVNPTRNRILDGETVYQVEPKVMAVLLCLQRHQGEVVSKETLFAEVWPDTAIGNEVLTRAISELRKTFSDDARAPQFIETIFKRGYRLMLAPQPSRPSPSVPRQLVVKEQRALPAPNRRKWRPSWVWAGLGLISAVAIATWMLLQNQPPTKMALIPELSRPMPVTTLAGHEYRSPISPDGHRIAFVWQGEDRQGDYDIYLKPIDEEGAVPFTQTEGNEDYPAWSPDGKYLAFARKHQDRSDLVMKPVIGGQERLLLSIDGAFYGLDWSPDGTSLAFGAQLSIDRPKQIFCLSLADLVPKPLTHPGESFQGDELPSWHDQGMGLAFIRNWNHGGEEDLFYLPLDLSRNPADSPKRLTFDRQAISGISWLPGNRGLVMISSRDGYWRLWQVSMPSGTVTPLPIASGFMMDPNVGPDGTVVTYTQKVVEQNIWAKSLDASPSEPGQQIIFSTHIDVSPVFSPDGTRLAWLSQRSGHFEVWTAQADGSHPRQVSRFRGTHISSPRWTPDGAHLLVTQTRLGNSDICRVSLKSGLIENLTEDPAREEKGFFSRDGRWLYFASNRSGSWQIWRRHGETQTLEQITQHGGFSAFEMEDGRLVYTKFDTQGIWQQGSNGTTESLLVTDFPPRYHGHWLLRNHHIWFLNWTGDDYQLFRQALDSESRELITRISRLGWERQSFTLSPDGKTLVYGQCDRMESDIMMVTLAKQAN